MENKYYSHLLYQNKAGKIFLLLLRHDIYTMWARVNPFWGNKYYCHCACHQKNMADGDSRHFQKYFSYIVVVSSIGVETGVPRENDRHWQIVSHNVISSTPRQLLVVICTYCTVSCKSNYHAITATTILQNKTKYEKT